MPVDLKAIRERYEADPMLSDDPTADRLRVARDVPALLELVEAQTGALLAAEWSIQGLERCPRCLGWKPDPSSNFNGGHSVVCDLDASLTLAGYPDKASRDAERNRRINIRTIADVREVVEANQGTFEADAEILPELDAERARRATIAQIQANVAAARAECLKEGHPGACKVVDAWPRHCSNGTKGCRQG